MLRRFLLTMAVAANGTVIGLHLGHLVKAAPDWAPQWSRVYLGICVTLFLALYLTFDDRPLR